VLDRERTEVTLILPADTRCPVIGRKWRRLDDGRIEARYTLAELDLVLELMKAIERLEVFGERDL